MYTGDIAIIKDIVAKYTNPSKEIQKAAETKLKSLRKDLGIISFSFLTLLQNKDLQPILKSTALTILKKILEMDGNDKWPTVSLDNKTKIKTLSLQLFLIEKDPILKPKHCEIILEILKYASNCKESWPELREALIQLYKKPLDFSELNVININLIIEAFANYFLFFVEDIRQNIKETIYLISSIYKSPSASFNLKSACSLLVKNLFLYSNNNEDRTQLLPFVQNIYFVMQQVNDLNDSKALISMLMIMVEIGNVSCIGFISFFSYLFDLLLKIALKPTDKKKDNDNHQEIAFSLIATIAQNEPNVFIKAPELFNQYVMSLLTYTLEMPKQIKQDWMNPSVEDLKDVPIITEQQINYIIKIFNQLILSLGKEYCKTYFIKCIWEIISKDDWCCQYIGLIVLSQIITVCNNIDSLIQFFPKIKSMIKHQNCKVRFASILCIVQLTKTYPKEYIKAQSLEIIPILCTNCYDETVHIVQSQIIKAITTVMIAMEDKINRRQNLKTVFDTLLNTFNKDNTHMMIRNEILTFFYHYIGKLEEDFAPFANKAFEIFMGYFAREYKNKSSKNLYGRLIMIIIQIGVYMDETFNGIIPDLNQAIFSIVSSISDPNDPSIKDVINAIEKLIPIIHSKFPKEIPILSESVIVLLKSLKGFKYKSSPMFKAKPNERNQSNIISNTIKLQETNFLNILLALNALLFALDNQFLPYVSNVEKELFDIISLETNTEIIQLACKALSSIISILPKDENRNKKAKECVILLFKKIENEEDLESTYFLLISIKKINKISGMIYSKQNIGKFFEDLTKLFNTHHFKRIERIKEIALSNNNSNDISNYNYSNIEIKLNSTSKSKKNKKQNNSNYQQQEITDCLIYHNAQIQLEIIKILSDCIKIYKRIIFDTIVTHILGNFIPKYINDDTLNLYSKRLILFLVNDLIEYLGEAYFSKDIWQYFFNILIDSASSSSDEIRQASCYGIGIIAKIATKEVYEQFCEVSIKTLILANKEKTKKKKQREFYLAKDSITAAIGRIIKYHSNSLFVKNNYSFILSTWANNLPIQYDKGEMEEQHEFLCDYIINNYDEIIKDKVINQMIKCLMIIYESKKSSDDCNKKMIDIFDKFKSNKDLFLYMESLAKNESDEEMKKKMWLILK